MNLKESVRDFFGFQDSGIIKRENKRLDGFNTQSGKKHTGIVILIVERRTGVY